MAWAAITEADVVTRISGTELEAYRAAALADGQVDPVAPAILQVTDLARGYIAACKENILGPDGTLPSKLKAPILDLIIVDIIKRLPGMVIDQARSDAQDAAIRLLEQVAACKFAVEEPTTTTDETLPGQTPSYTSRDREFDRSSQDGI
jgi:hypothetical protein